MPKVYCSSADLMIIDRFVDYCHARQTTAGTSVRERHTAHAGPRYQRPQNRVGSWTANRKVSFYNTPNHDIIVTSQIRGSAGAQRDVPGARAGGLLYRDSLSITVDRSIINRLQCGICTYLKATEATHLVTVSNCGHVLKVQYLNLFRSRASKINTPCRMRTTVR